MKCKKFDDDSGLVIEEHPTSFLDKNFNDKFVADETDKDVVSRPVEIRALDAGWIFK